LGGNREGRRAKSGGGLQRALGKKGEKKSSEVRYQKFEIGNSPMWGGGPAGQHLGPKTKQKKQKRKETSRSLRFLENGGEESARAVCQRGEDGESFEAEILTGPLGKKRAKSLIGGGWEKKRGRGPSRPIQGKENNGGKGPNSQRKEKGGPKRVILQLKMGGPGITAGRKK